jgi:hypothetical protein
MSLYHTLKLAFEIGRPLTATQLLETAIAHDNHVHELRAAHAGVLSRIAALDAENAELRKDAERYRWLKANADHETHFDHTLSDSFGGNYHELRVPFESQSMWRGPSLDEAIDAAISGAAK